MYYNDFVEETNGLKGHQQLSIFDEPDTIKEYESRVILNYKPIIYTDFQLKSLYNRNIQIPFEDKNKETFQGISNIPRNKIDLPKLKAKAKFVL